MTTDAFPSGSATLMRHVTNQLGGTFLTPGSSLSLASLMCTLLLAAFLAVPRGRRIMPRLAAWRRALFPRRLWRSASSRADFGYFLFSGLGGGVLFGAMLWSGTAIAGGVDRALDRVSGPTAILPLPPAAAATLLTLATFLAYEFAYWLDHYLKHRSALLWQFHRVHHAAESLSLLTIFRVHPVDTIVFLNIVAVATGLTRGVLAHLLGPAAQPWAIGGTNALVLLTAAGLTHLQHSHLWVTFGPRWSRRLLGPAHHQIHHSADPRHFDRNFGNTLALFDRLFGTLHVPGARREVQRFGLDGAVADPHGWRAQLITPFAAAFALVVPPRRPAVPAEQR